MYLNTSVTQKYEYCLCRHTRSKIYLLSTSSTVIDKGLQFHSIMQDHHRNLLRRSVGLSVSNRPSAVWFWQRTGVSSSSVKKRHVQLQNKRSSLHPQQNKCRTTRGCLSVLSLGRIILHRTSFNHSIQIIKHKSKYFEQHTHCVLSSDSLKHIILYFSYQLVRRTNKIAYTCVNRCAKYIFFYST